MEAFQLTTPDNTTPEPPDDPPSGDSSERRYLLQRLANHGVARASVTSAVTGAGVLGRDDDLTERLTASGVDMFLHHCAPSDGVLSRS
jgi:hypothetical protein